jgi:ribonuclease HIII
LKLLAPHSIVAIGPERYNDLHDRMKNLNRLLAWGHARAIENLLGEVTCDRVVTDQFGDERFVARAMMERGKQVRLEQRPRAEDDLAVAAASILARAEFLQWLERLSEEIGMLLPKGAGPAVDETARQIIKREGIDLLRRVAKVHFKTTQKALIE